MKMDRINKSKEVVKATVEVLMSVILNLLAVLSPSL